MKKQTLACLYARFSPRRDAEQSLSIEGQQSLMMAHAKRRGYRVVGSFFDANKSGGDIRRPGLWEAVQQVPRGGVLLVEKLDRLARSAYLEETILRQLARKQATVVPINGEPAGHGESSERALVRKIFAAFAEYERVALAERTSARMRQLQENGHVVGAVPYGYRRVVVGEKVRHGLTVADARLEEDDDEQAVIQAVLTLRREEQWGYRRIASYLADLGVETRGGKPMEHSLVKRIIARHNERAERTEAVL